MKTHAMYAIYRKTVDHVWHKTIFIRYPSMCIGGLMSLERKFHHFFCEKYFEIIKSNFGDITHCNIRVLAPASHKTVWKRLFNVQVVSMGTNVSKPGWHDGKLLSFDLPFDVSNNV